jgi:hypothetical protein
LRDEAEAGGVLEILVQAFEIFGVEGVIDVGAEIQRELLCGEI